MAGRIRSIKPEILEDEVAAGLSDSAWRLWVSLWVLADDHGGVRLGTKYLAASVWHDTRKTKVAEKALRELLAKGRVHPYAVNAQRYGRIHAWGKHQRVDNASKPRVPTDLENDGSWNQGDSLDFAETLREPLRTAAETTRSPRIAEVCADSPLARAPAQSGGETTDLDLDHDLDHDRDRARVAKIVPERTGNLPDNLVNLERSFWIKAYEQAVDAEQSSATDPYTFPEKAFKALRSIVEKHCRGEDRKDIAGWIGRDVRAFVRALDGLDTDWRFWSGGKGPDGLQKWHNDQRPGLERASGVVQVSPPPPLEPHPMTAKAESDAAAAILAQLEGRDG